MAFQFDRRFANAERERDDANPRKSRLRIYPGFRWAKDPSDGQYKTWSDRQDAGEQELNAAAGRVRVSATEPHFRFFDPETGNALGDVRLVPQVFSAGAWVDVSLAGPAGQRTREDADHASWQWRYATPALTLDAMWDVTPGQGKWTYRLIANQAGQYRLALEVRPAPGSVAFTVTSAKRLQAQGFPESQAIWRFADRPSFRFNWLDLHDAGVIAQQQVDAALVRLLLGPFDMGAGASVVLDPSIAPDAAFGEDMRAGAEFPNDGIDAAGGDGANSFRTANRFTITTLPTDATVDQVDFQINVLGVVSTGALLWDIDGYNGTGQGDPEADSAATAYAACDVAGVYANDTTQFRTTGSKTFTALGATANADVEAARDAGTTFCVAIRETTNTTAAQQAQFAEYTHADPPTLTITYTEAATKLYLKNSQINVIGPTYYDMVIGAGTAADTAVVDSTTAGTEIQWTKTAGGAVAQWISGRVPSGGFTLASVDISIWAKEDNVLTNVGGRFRVFKRDSGGTEVELGGGPFDDGVEFTTSDAEYTWTGNPTDTAFVEDDRVLLKLYITNIGAMVIGAATLTFNAAAAATGDSFFSVFPPVAFKEEGTTGGGTPGEFDPDLQIAGWF